MFKAMPWPDFLSDTNTGDLLGTKIAVIIIHVAFQTGFCTFVLSNYMKTIPKELGEAALVDGASVVRQFFQIVMPLCRPALAALATLEFTWLYNDFFWGVVLLNQGERAADHLVDRQSRRPVLQQRQPHRRRLDDHRRPHARGVSRTAAAFHQRSDPRSQQGVISLLAILVRAR